MKYKLLTINMKNKGFTLVEMIGALIILGLLLIIAVPSVAKLIGQNRKKYYESLEKTLEQQAVSYISDNRNARPKRGEKTFVCAKTLVSEGYIDEIVDYNKRKCDVPGENDAPSFVVLERMDDGTYKSTACLICDRSGYTSDLNTKPICNVDFIDDEALKPREKCKV